VANLRHLLLRAREDGETLIEVVIAVLIVGIVSAALTGAILASLSASEMNRDSADADVILRTYASDVLAQAQSTAAWSSNTCPPLDVPDDVLQQASSHGFTPSATAVSCDGGFESVVVRVSKGTLVKSLEIWAREP
jgi:Tfp pilus assembly protein PilV